MFIFYFLKKMKTLISKYKIYGRAKGRKKKGYNLDQTFINSIVSKEIDINIKDNNILDIGSGSGENSIYQSMKFPMSKIIACEIFVDGNINLCHKIFKKKLNNILIYNSNVLELFDTIRKKNIFDTIWILFPDPWPKKRHFKRRLINNDFMNRLIFMIKKNGKIHITTDSQSYLRQILSSIYKFRNDFFWVNQSIDSWIFDLNQLPQTKFYKKAIKSNRKPFYIKLKKL